MRIYKKFSESHRVTLHLGNCMDLLKALPDECVDLVVTSPPYCIGKAYEDPHNDIKTFKDQHDLIFDELYRVMKPGGSICWQVGYHISDKCVVPLDYIVYEIFTSRSENLDYPFILRNRIIWTFGHAYEEIKEQETQAMIDCGDEYAIECTGQVEMDPDELNDLVADRDPHALEFFGLTEADEDELEEWDAHDLDELPLRCDFEEGFEPYSPFDEGWQLLVQFPRPDEMEDAYLEEPEARETLTELFQAANGDYSVVDDYVSRCSGYLPWDSDLDLQALALEIAASLCLEDYVRTHTVD